MSIKQSVGCLIFVVFGGLAGASATTLITSPETVIETVVTEKVITIEVEKPIITEKIVTVEIEKPIITQQIVETVREVEVYRFIDEDRPVHKWVDPDNQAVVYIYPEGYTGEIWPMYSLVPPVWFDQMLLMILDMNDGFMPPEIINAVPKEWMEAVAPGTEQNTQPLN